MGRRGHRSGHGTQRTSHGADDGADRAGHGTRRESAASDRGRDQGGSGAIIKGRRVGLPRDEEQEEENSGSNDHNLHRLKGDTARYLLRHRQLPYREDAPASLRCNHNL
jgi:hypothetical protein